MTDAPRVSIVIPAFNDADWIAQALDSCLSQTLDQIEVICVDDVSTDQTADIVAEYGRRDPRVRLLRHEVNSSPFQARRTGVFAASAPYILFLDGDDELSPSAAERAVSTAASNAADLVGFGAEVLDLDGRNSRSLAGFQERLAAFRSPLAGEAIVRKLFPSGEPAHGQLWRYLFSTQLLRDAYSSLPDDLVLRRANDLPITFLAVASAAKYASVPERLYRYYFRRGGSGQMVTEQSQFEFYLGALDSIDAIAKAVRERARVTSNADSLLSSYESARRSVIGSLLSILVKRTDPSLLPWAIDRLVEKAPGPDVTLAAVLFCKSAMPLLAQHGRRIELGDHKARSILLTTSFLRTGGISGVLLSQARYLLAAGYHVTVAAQRPGSEFDEFPEGAEFLEIAGNDDVERLESWAEICRARKVDVVIDHQVLYTQDWPAYALVARSLGAATIGWIHNFAARPLYDQTSMVSFLTDHMSALATVITLSPLDVAFWKLRGVENAAYLPNPPSPMIMESSTDAQPKSLSDGNLSLVWWGRLEQRTKQVRELVEVAERLRDLGVRFRLSIIGPDWRDLTAAGLSLEVAERNLSDYVEVVGPLRGAELLKRIDDADIFVNTSIIEGYPLTLAEAQSRGLPIVMYDLPWLAILDGNDGVVRVPQGARDEMAASIAAIGADPQRYRALSRGSIQAAESVRALEFGLLYRKLVDGGLPQEYSPEPTLDDAMMINELVVFFVERSAGRRGARSRKARAQGGRQTYGFLTLTVHYVGRKAPRLMALAVRAKRAIIGPAQAAR